MAQPVYDLSFELGPLLMAITTLNVAFDESGKRDQAYTVFGGLFATSAKWDEFSREWNMKLRKKGINVWHTVEAAHLNGQFKKFRGHRKALDDLALSLTDTICCYAFGAQCSHVSSEEFSKLKPETKKQFKDPFYCAFEAGIRALVSGPEVDPNDRFNLLCHDSEEHPRECLDVYQRFKRLEPVLAAKIGALCFVDDNAHPPIQAADLLVYCRRRELEGNSPLVWSEVMKKIYSRFHESDSSEILVGK